MGEVQKQRYICKICNKSCVSGKSLGGHMRVHLAEISASKKAAKAKAKVKAEIKMDCEVDDEEDNCYQLRGSTKTQSNSAFRDEEQIKNRDSNTDSEDADQNSSYELRENPKKSWRFSDPRRGLTISKDGASCKECGKKFSTLRALSGHMRTHSIRNKKETHPCKECGKAFDSMRAMFGHMKSHPKRSRVADDSTDSLSDLDNLCPVRKKRSTIRYKSAPSPSLSNLNESNSNVDLGDVKEVAKILIMLSRGVRNWSKFDLVIESPDDDDFVYVGADVSRRSNKIVGNDGDLVCDADNKISMSFSIGKFDSCHPSCANALEDSNVSEFVNKDAIKVGFGVADDEKLLSVENETKVDLETDDRVEVDEHEPLDEFAVKQDCANEKGSLVMNEASLEFVKFYSCNKVIPSVQESHFETNSSENEANLDISKEFDKQQEFLKLDKSKGYECPVCFKVFPSGQALGGHKRAHYTVNEEAVVEVDNDLFDLNYPVAADDRPRIGVGLDLWWVERAHEHEALVLTN